MAALWKWVSTSVLSSANRGVILHVPSVSNNQVLSIGNYVSKTNRIVHKLGIPEPPKRPPHGFIRFQKENEDSLRKISKSQTDFFSLAGSKWRELSEDQKAKYNDGYKKEFAEYQRVYKEYLQKLTPEQKKAIKTERKVLKENREAAAEKKMLKNELQSVGKPKKSVPAFMLFVADKAKNSNVRAKDLKNDWANLNEEQKRSYILKAQQLRDNYQEELKAWEDKMMAEGKAHFVRKNRFLTKKTVEPKRGKKVKPE